MIPFVDHIDYDIAHEQALLGALLIDEEAFDLLGTPLNPAWFYMDAHQHVASAMLRMRSQKRAIDPVTLAKELAPLSATVDPQFVWGLFKGIGTSANAKFYADNLRDMHLRRQVRLVAESAIAAAPVERGMALLQRIGNAMASLEIQSAKPVRKLSEIVVDRIVDLQRQSELQEEPHDLIPSGYMKIDERMSGFRIGRLYVVAARPGVGKTALMRGLQQRMSLREPCGIFMLEDYGDELADREIAARAHIYGHKLRDGRNMTGEDWNRIDNAFPEGTCENIWVDDQHGRTIEDICSGMRQMARKHKIRVFFLDVLAEVELPDVDRTDRAIGIVCRKYRDTAKDLDAVPILNVHLNRETEKDKKRRPRLSDLKNSGDIEDAAYAVLMLSRDPEKEPDKMCVDFVKLRGGEPGPIYLKWNGAFMSVEDP